MRALGPIRVGRGKISGVRPNAEPKGAHEHVDDCMDVLFLPSALISRYSYISVLLSLAPRPSTSNSRLRKTPKPNFSMSHNVGSGE